LFLRKSLSDIYGQSPPTEINGEFLMSGFLSVWITEAVWQSELMA